MDQLLECIGAGCCVVSTCEELAYPFRKHPELSKRLDESAIEEGVAIIGTGVNPGFVMDKLVLTLSAVAQKVETARAIRIVDASKRRLPLQKKIGAGMTSDEFKQQVAAGVIKHHGLPESIAMVADGLGIEVDDITETIEPMIAEETVKTEFLEVAPGQVTGVHQTGRGIAGGKEKIFMELKMYVGAKHPGDTVELTGQPNISLTIPGGTHGDVATAAVAVNAIPTISRRQRWPSHIPRPAADVFRGRLKVRRTGARRKRLRLLRPRNGTPLRSPDRLWPRLSLC